VLRKG